MNKFFTKRFAILCIAVLTCQFTIAQIEFELGNTTDFVTDGTDGFSANIIINKTDTYTNDTGEELILNVDKFSFNARALNDPMTPFIVKVNGDTGANTDFTVVAIGTTRLNNVYVVGENTFDFFDGDPKSITLAVGETLAIGFIDSNPDGTGGGTGSVVPFNSTAIDVEIDLMWYTGGGTTEASGSIAEGDSPVQGTGFTGELSRDYLFNITFVEAEEVEEPEEPEEPTASIVDFETTSSSFVVYPNPASDVITIEADLSAVEGNIELLDLTGRSLLSADLAAENQINVSNIPSGIYVLKIGGSSQKIVIE